MGFELGDFLMKKTSLTECQQGTALACWFQRLLNDRVRHLSGGQAPGRGNVRPGRCRGQATTISDTIGDAVLRTAPKVVVAWTR